MYLICCVLNNSLWTGHEASILVLELQKNSRGKDLGPFISSVFLGVMGSCFSQSCQHICNGIHCGECNWWRKIIIYAHAIKGLYLWCLKDLIEADQDFYILLSFQISFEYFVTASNQMIHIHVILKSLHAVGIVAYNCFVLLLEYQYFACISSSGKG